MIGGIVFAGHRHSVLQHDILDGEQLILLTLCASLSILMLESLVIRESIMPNGEPDSRISSKRMRPPQSSIAVRCEQAMHPSPMEPLLLNGIML